MTLKALVLGVRDDYWSSKYAIYSAARCQEKQKEALEQRFLCAERQSLLMKAPCLY